VAKISDTVKWFSLKQDRINLFQNIFIGLAPGAYLREGHLNGVSLG
jgi:hypothetical protein